MDPREGVVVSAAYRSANPFVAGVDIVRLDDRGRMGGGELRDDSFVGGDDYEFAFCSAQRFGVSAKDVHERAAKSDRPRRRRITTECREVASTAGSAASKIGADAKKRLPYG